MPEATIRLLGGFSADVDGHPVPDGAWRLKKAREMVKLLALAPGQRLHAEQLMDVLWRELAPAAASNNLDQAVHVARRALGPETIKRSEGMLALAADVDVVRFESAALDARRTGTPAAYRAALSLYAGDLLPENRYDDWAEERRQGVDGLHAALVAELAGLGAVDGLRPLPAPTSSFLGRRQALRDLDVLFSGTRLLTLTGAGGTGKTRLAIELARAFENDGRDVVLVELAPVEDAGLVTGAVAAALDVHAMPGVELEDAVVEFVATRALTLLLDNCEHVLEHVARLTRRLLGDTVRLTILATSREPLQIPGERVFVVPPLEVPDPDLGLSPDELHRYEGVSLFVERAAAAAPGFALGPGNVADVARICFRLDGLPLALELAAARIGALAPRAIAARLDDRFRLLGAGNRGAPTRQQTLEATLAWSHELLRADERTLFRRLGVFSGSFDLEAVEEVCGGAGLSAETVADLLARLVAKSLVMTVEHEGDRRYRLLETIRMYAAGRLEESAEAASLDRRHATWALTTAEQENGSARLDPEAANFRRALDFLMADDVRGALRLCVALWPFWLRRIELDESLRRFDDALAVVTEPSSLRAEALLDAVSLTLRAGRLGNEFTRSIESLSISEALGEARLQWRALHILGGSAASHDDGHATAAWFERALKLAQAEGFAAAEASCLHSLGVTHWRMNHVRRAEELVLESIASLRRLAASSELIPTPLAIIEMRNAAGRIVVEDTFQPFVDVTCPVALGYAIANHASIRRGWGDLVEARQLLEDALRQFASVGDDRGQADVLLRQAHLELVAAAPTTARSQVERALELRRRLGDRRGVGMALSALGRVETSSGDFRAAEQWFAEARAIFRRAGDRWGLTAALWSSADLAVTKGDLDDAQRLLEEALALQVGRGRDRWQAETLARLAEVALLGGDDARAVRLLGEAQERFVTGHDEVGAMNTDRQLHALRVQTNRGHASNVTT